MAGTKKYRGVVVPMITPFPDAGEIDIPAVLHQEVDKLLYQCRWGCDELESG